MSDLDRAQAEWAARIMGLRFRNRHTGRVSQVTDVVPHGPSVRVVLDGRVKVSPQGFAEGWGNGKGKADKADNSGA